MLGLSLMPSDLPQAAPGQVPDACPQVHRPGFPPPCCEQMVSNPHTGILCMTLSTCGSTTMLQLLSSRPACPLVLASGNSSSSHATSTSFAILLSYRLMPTVQSGSPSTSLTSTCQSSGGWRQWLLNLGPPLRGQPSQGRPYGHY